MSKLESNIINSIKMLSLDMIKEAGSGNVNLTLIGSSIFYTLFMEHLKFDVKNTNWINRDRVITSNEFLPVMYSTLHMFGYNISLDNLRADIPSAALPLNSVISASKPFQPELPFSKEPFSIRLPQVLYVTGIETESISTSAP